MDGPPALDPTYDTPAKTQCVGGIKQPPLSSFENGALNLYGVFLTESSDLLNKTVRETADLFGDRINFIPIFIIRSSLNYVETIVPRGDTVYMKDDHVYFIALEAAKETLYRILGQRPQQLSLTSSGF